ncbi:peptide/nickel transport system permease protein [Antricoccus suffuscus]|uniref:Peptide/nickel transport system permease protein n=1 Tax=Antricoccus suffuscus TaxID=1629062 RepID=A0A2T1A781_9ACTN|nr:ABC transporter permease [Antricoccus suffuscus]PRZ44188.1 peptide/nickel transport system permease protein [Antricoccus suffuscus]
MKRLNPSLIIGGVLVSLVVITAVVSFFWTPYNPILNNGADKFAPISGAHWLGADKFGRDELSRLMAGARTTLLVGIVAVSIAAVIGVPLGIWAAMSRRWVGEVVMRGNDLLLAFPALLLAIMLSAIYKGGTLVAMIAIGIATVPTFARVSRAGTLQVMQTEYVLAARAAGNSRLAIARRHILPNISSLVIVQSSIAFAIAILAEAALSYLGLGTQTPNPSWGIMLLESQDTLYKALSLGLIPGIAIALSVLGFNLLGDGLRDKLDATLVDVQ